MSIGLTTLTNSIFTFCIIFISSGCTAESEKTIPKVHIVEIKQMKFQPAELTIQKGDTVVWVNKDIVAHDVTEESGKAWASSLMPVGQSWSSVITESADYYCSIHPIMKGSIYVQ